MPGHGRWSLPDLRARKPGRPLLSDLAPRLVRASGRRVSTWTVDGEEDMARVVAAGVDAVVSNRIGTLVRVLGRPSRSTARGD